MHGYVFMHYQNNNEDLGYKIQDLNDKNNENGLDLTESICFSLAEVEVPIRKHVFML